MTPKPFLDIFSKRKPKSKLEASKPRIIVDYRERNSLVMFELQKMGFEIETRELKVADYIVRNVAIERKTISDFISSMINKRLLRQLEELQQYQNKILIIEGLEEQELYNDLEEINGVHPNAIRGFLLSILLKSRIPVLFTKNSEDTAKFISVIAKKKANEISLNVTKKTLDNKERLQFILEGFPGIGPKSARKLLEKFKTIKNIANASEQELQEVLGKKAEIMKKLLEEHYD